MSGQFIASTPNGRRVSTSDAGEKDAILKLARKFYSKTQEVNHVSNDPHPPNEYDPLRRPNLHAPCVQHWNALDHSGRVLGDISVICRQDAGGMPPGC